MGGLDQFWVTVNRRYLLRFERLLRCTIEYKSLLSLAIVYIVFLIAAIPLLRPSISLPL